MDSAGISERGVDAAHLTAKEIAPGITGRVIAERFEVPDAIFFFNLSFYYVVKCD
jgi:hypothetical protein